MTVTTTSVAAITAQPGTGTAAVAAPATAASGDDYPAVKIVGNVLPPEVIPAVSLGRLPRMSAGDYDLPVGMTPDNAAAHAYTYLQPIWQAWNQHINRNAAHGPDAVTFTREQWLLPLLKHLGYEDDHAPVRQPHGITIPTGFLDETATYPISHEVVHGRDTHGQSSAALPIHLVGPDVNLDHKLTGAKGARAPHSMLQEFLNRTQTRLYGLITNGHTLRLLRDITNLDRQAYVEFDLDQIFANNLQRDFRLLWLLLHATRFTPATPAAPQPDEGEADIETDEETLSLDSGEDESSDEDEAAPVVAVLSAPSPTTCTMEVWRATVFNEGTRALDSLRDGIASAITALGTGFVRHPDNTQLRTALAENANADDDLRRWLLRCAYRLIVLFVAEDRELLHIPTGSKQQRDTYARYFSTRRLRTLAATSNGTRHHDLWDAHRIVTDALGGDGLASIGLLGLGASLYEPEALGLLQHAKISNHYFLAAIRHLSLVTDKHGIRRPVDYRNLDSEELGAAYEALLAYVPRYTPADQVPDHAFTLALAPGSERKKSGSYYTPTSLITVVLDETLDPLIHENLNQPDPEAAILGLTVCDPACGSGHFLVAAARRLARALATLRTGDPEPSPEALRDAMRDVVANCIYGVDLNDLATEITKVALWLESLQPGVPFAFLDHHIKQGNALIGTTPDLLRRNIPDDAFKALPGDDKDTTKRLKALNKGERQAEERNQTSLFDAVDLLPDTRVQHLVETITAVEDLPQKTLAEVRAFAAAWRNANSDPELQQARLVADAWCAAFMQPKPAGTGHVGITHAVLTRLGDGELVPAPIHELITGLATVHRYFHWHLEFPQVLSGEAAGFSCVLGNPPWEMVQLNEKEFFGARGRTDIEAQKNGARRKAIIAEIERDDPALWAAYQDALLATSATANFVQQSGRYPLTAVGKIDYYPLFAEHNTQVTRRDGRAGFLTPTGLAVDKTRSAFFRNLMMTRRIAAFYDFRNEGFFPTVGKMIRFAINIVAGAETQRLKLSFLNSTTHDIQAHLVSLSAEDVSRLNPNTGTLPLLARQQDADIVSAAYRRFPVIRAHADPSGNPWHVDPGAMFNMTTDAHQFLDLADLREATRDGHARVLNGVRYLPLYEGKHFWHYDHRYATSDGVPDPNKPRPLSGVEQCDPSVEIQPRYWVPEAKVRKWYGVDWDKGSWDLAFRDIARASDARTMVISVTPRSAAGNVAPLLRLTNAQTAAVLLAVMSSLPFDWTARQKLSGAHMNLFILDQLPTPAPDDLAQPAPFSRGETWAQWLLPRVLELTFTSHSLTGWARDLGYDGAPFPWNANRRREVQAELDGALFHLYGHDRSTTEYIIDSFTTLRRAETREFGEYLTKRLVVDAYEHLAAQLVD